MAIRPERSADLYPDSGTSIDHVYGVHRIPAFGIETGDYFHPLEPEFADIQKKNEPVLDYSVRIADDPYERAQGPDVAQLALTPAGQLSAAASDASTGGQLIRAAEWTTNPLAVPGTGTPLAAADGAFDGVNETMTGTYTPVPVKIGKGPNLIYGARRGRRRPLGPDDAAVDHAAHRSADAARRSADAGAVIADNPHDCAAIDR